jgi:hypothetical protein
MWKIYEVLNSHNWQNYLLLPYTNVAMVFNVLLCELMDNTRTKDLQRKQSFGMLFTFWIWNEGSQLSLDGEL